MSIFSNHINLFWWSEPRFMGKPYENYGDYLGVYLAEKISGEKVKFSNPKRISWPFLSKPIYATAGSILAHVNQRCVVWGSGIISADQEVKPTTFLAVRGPETRRQLVAQGHVVPEIYGDPALLLPKYFSPKIEKKYTYGIIPHYVDYEFVNQKFNNESQVRVINLMTNDVELTTKQILECEKIISSSLHGLIVPHAYNIPAVWVRFSDKLFGDNIKFKDYFKSVSIDPYQPEIDEGLTSVTAFHDIFGTGADLPSPEVINQLQQNLLSVCPFA